MRVLRHQLKITEATELDLDTRSEYLHVDIKGDEDVISLWVTDYGGPRVHRRFIVKGTGVEFDGRGLRHVGTALEPSRTYVWHVFEQLHT